MIKKKNNETRKPKGKGRGPSQQEFESKCSAGEPASRGLRPWSPLNPMPPGGASSQPLAGAPLPQSSEMERRLKMGRRRPGSRLGDSEPLRLPELSEPLR